MRFSRRTLRRIGALLIAVLALPAFPSPAVAGEPTDQIRSAVEMVLAIIQDAPLKGEEKKEERRAALRKAIARRFDFEEMAKRSLAKIWKKRSPKERTEFIRLFSLLMEASYIGKLELYTGEAIRYTKEDTDGDFTQVDSHIVTASSREISIYYRMHKVNGEWKVYDVIIENVSLIQNFRQQFRRVIRRTSYEDLVKKLRAKAGEE
jgi:phospholipid transport system substrate-binding protein